MSVARAHLSKPIQSREQYKVLYNFGLNGDGIYPAAGLLYHGGTFYGTTVQGGTSNQGTVYSVTKAGHESVLHSFAGGSDAAYPYSDPNLIAVGGLLYGTATQAGGSSNGGALFSVNPSNGAEAIVGSLNTLPYAGLLNVNGKFYGTTNQGGPNICGAVSCGRVFSMTQNGAQATLHNFDGTDGDFPYANLVDVAGTLYGTTGGGGTNGWGTIFSIAPNGRNFHSLYSFAAGADGAYPGAGLTVSNGVLYGTTYQGGSSNDGTIFAYNLTSHGETVIYPFTGPNGANPKAGVILDGDLLLGTTQVGGAYGLGTAFEFSLASDTGAVLHSFGNGSDGASPEGGLTRIGGTAWGTTNGGGTKGFGTVFSLSV